MMKFRTLLLPLFILSVLVSCKKDEVEKEYMDGSFKIVHSMPSYVTPGSTYTFSVSGITAPDGTAVGYSFKDPVTKVTDTTSVYTYTVPDTLGTFSILCTAFAVESSDLYYSSSTSIKFTTVSENGTLGNIDISLDSGSADLRSRTYPIVTVAGTDWICFNLSYIERDASGTETFGRSYVGCTALQNVLGAYYTWEEARTACPEGWRLPSDSDWVQLLKSVGAPDTLAPLQDSPSGAGKLMCGITFNGSAMWEFFRGVTVTNESGLCVIPTGYANVFEGSYDFSGLGSYAAFWTSDESGTQGVYRYIYQENDNVYAGLADKDTFAASVRCVR